MRELIQAMENMRGKEVTIHTQHKLFGNQNIEMRFSPEYEIGFGFRCNGQRIYIRDDELVTYYFSDNVIELNSEQMKIKVLTK